MPSAPKIPLIRSWNEHVQSAVLHVISMAQLAATSSRGWATKVNGRISLKARIEQLEQEILLLREEIRIKDVRLASISPHKRPHFKPPERMAILELRAARGWSLRQTADAFLLAPATVASWMKRLDEQGPDALLQLREPVNRFPDFVRYAVGRLKTLCPTMGKVKIAQTLARAGLHVGATTVGRMLKESPPSPKSEQSPRQKTKIVARYPDHVYHIDLTTVPIGSGYWTSWLPNALPPRWPFCWWSMAVIDHYSRRVVSIGVFAKKPDCRTACSFLGKAFRKRKPKYLICDRDSIFDCDAFRSWSKRTGIKPPRYGAAHQHGSIAVIERFFRTFKTEFARSIVLALERRDFRHEVVRYAVWYNEHRPHMTLEGRTPNEVYFGRKPANRAPRIEPREDWPRRSKCASPQTLVAGKPGDRFAVDVAFQHGQRHLPVVTVRRAA